MQLPPSVVVLLNFALITVDMPISAQPSSARQLDGVYMGWRFSTMIARPVEDYITFFPDGRVLYDDPAEGLGAPINWEEACEHFQCGTYRVQGNRVTVRWSSGSERQFEIQPNGSLSETGRSYRFLPLDPLDGLRLDGRYAQEDKEHDVLMVAITFSPDGRFTEESLLTFISWARGPHQTERERVAVERGSGRYSIRRNTLELRYDTGLVVRLMFSILPGIARGPRPASIYLGQLIVPRAD